MKIKNILIVLIFVFSCFAELNFDTKMFFIFSQEEGADDPFLDHKIWKIDSRIHLLKQFPNDLSIYFDYNANGSTRYLALPEREIPFINHLESGLLLEKKINLYAGIQNDIFVRADDICPYYLPNDSMITPKMLTGVNLNLNKEWDKVSLLIDMNYFRLNYNLKYGEDNYNKKKKSIDDDLWTEFNLTFLRDKELNISLGTMLKNDFNSYGGFDYGDHYLGIEGNHSIRMSVRRLYLMWNLEGHFRVSEALYRKGDAYGPAAVVYLHPVLKLRKNKFLKARILLDLSKKMQKQLYEFKFRKAGRKGSSVDFGYWALVGSLFPRMAFNANSTLSNGKLGIRPDFEVFFRLIDEKKYKFYRVTYSLEAFVDILNHIEIYLGYSSSVFENMNPFIDRRALFFGIRKW